MNIPNRVTRLTVGNGLAALLWIAGLGQPQQVAAADVAFGIAAPPPQLHFAAGPALFPLRQTGWVTSTLPPGSPETYWTEARMRNAQPYPLELELPLRNGPPVYVAQAPGAPGWHPSRAPDGVNLPIITDNPPMTLPSPVTPTVVYTTTYGNLADATRFPYSTIGKAYFTQEGVDYSCTGAVIGEYAVWTAAHCVTDGSGIFHSNWIFVPGYAYDTSPVSGQWTAAYKVVPARFHTDLDLAADYGIVIVNPVAGRTIRQVTGALGFAWNLPNPQLVRAQGYSVPFYGGQRLVESEGYSLLTDTSFSPPTIGIYSKLKSGSSGGPWLLNVRADAVGEANYLNGDVSYQNYGTPQVFSPTLDDVAKRLWDCAQYSTPTVIDCHAGPQAFPVSLADAGSSIVVAPGAPLTYRLTIANPSLLPAANVRLTLKPPAGEPPFAGGDLPGGVCAVVGEGARYGALCTLDTLPAGAVMTATVAFTVPAEWPENAYDALASVSADVASQFVTGADGSNARIGTFVGTISPGVMQTAASVMAAGAPFSYTLNVWNNGPQTANNVILVDTLPAGVTLGSVTWSGGDCGVTNGVVTCALAALDAGRTATATLTVTTPAAPFEGDLTNLASVTADETSLQWNSSLVTAVRAPNLALRQAASHAAVQVGTPLSYTLTIENRGPLAAADVALIDTLPAGATFVSAVLPGGSCAQAGGVVTCSLAELPVAALVSATLTVNAPAQPGSIVNLTSVTSSQPDAHPEDSLDISLTTRVEACWARRNDDATLYDSAQAAVDAAQPGDVVKLAGTCVGVSVRPAPAGYSFATGVSQTVFIAKDLTLRGGYTVTNWAVANPAANPTTLDAVGEGRALFVAGGKFSVTVEGLRLTGGVADGPGGGGGYILGGGVTLANNTFIGNDARAGSGGGLSIQPESQVTLSGNALVSNTALLGGGGLYIFRATNALLDGNLFSDNTISHGNGEGLALYNSPNAIVNDNSFSANRLAAATDAGGSLYVGQSDGAVVHQNRFAHNTGNGGGLTVATSDGVLVSDNTFHENTGSSGGGLSIISSNYAIVDGNSFSRNLASGDGGAVFIGILANYLHERPSNVTLRNNMLISNTATTAGGGLNLSASDAITLVNNIVADNVAASGSGGAIQNASVWLAHTTLANNSGDNCSGLQIAGNSRVTLINTIVATHSVGLCVATGAAAAVDSVLWSGTPITVAVDAEAGWSVANSYTGDPAFVNPAAGDYHLGPTSAAIDSGVAAGVTTDIDGDQRIIPDLGADELAQRSLWLPSILR